MNHGNIAIMKKLGLRRGHMQVLEHVMDGKTNAQIAACLGVSEKAVKSILTTVYTKVGLDSRPRMIVGLIKAGWMLSPDVKLPGYVTPVSNIGSLPVGIST